MHRHTHARDTNPMVGDFDSVSIAIISTSAARVPKGEAETLSRLDECGALVQRQQSTEHKSIQVCFLQIVLGDWWEGECWTHYVDQCRCLCYLLLSTCDGVMVNHAAVSPRVHASMCTHLLVHSADAR